MSEKKHIDRLFQEKFKDFDAKPNAKVWNSIRQSLTSDKKVSSVVPLWIKLSGVVATLLLLLYIGFTYRNSKLPSTETIVNTERNNNVEKSNPSKNNSSSKESTNNKPNDITPVSQSKTTVDKKGSHVLKSSKEQLTNNENSNTLQNNTINTSKAKTHLQSKESETLLANTILTPTNQNRSSNPLLNNPLRLLGQLYNPVSINHSFLEISPLKSIDSLLQHSQNGLSGLLVDDLELKDDEESKTYNKWSVTANIAPVYFNTLGSGSSIHPEFNNNPKSGNVNLSYGISGAFAISNRLQIRTGVNQVKLGYNTNDVVVYNNINNNSLLQVNPSNSDLLRNIDVSPSAQNMSFLNVDSFAFAQVPGFLSDLVDSSIEQRLGFIELPLELSYKAIDKRMDLSLIGGFSALFLNENEVYTIQKNRSTLIGEANNLNKTSFSANFGIGLDFELSKHLNLNLEPTFKYQLNTFSDTSGDFKPFFIGVYSGIKFKF